MIGPLKKGANGNWVFGVLWKRTGTVGNVDATPEVDQDKRYDLGQIDADKPAAQAAYRSILSTWYGKDADENIIPISEIVSPMTPPGIAPIGN